MSIQNSHQISEVKVMLAKGIDGNGIASIEKTGTQGLVDIYTITYTNGEKTTFTVTNGAGGGMSALLLITSDAGSEVTVTTPSGRVITATQVSGSSTQWQAETTEYGVHTIDAVLNGSDAQVTQNVDTCKIYLIDDSHFSASITVKYPDGYTCRCQGSQESAYATESPYTFSVHSADTYTITVTDGTDTYTDTVVITTDGQTESLTCPAPADVPANDIDWWLWYGGIDNSGGTYTSLADILLDATALATLMANTEAVDYLVRCTSWISDITGNQRAMSYIGLNNYCADVLLSDLTWLTAIVSSLYKESVLNVKVPTMTANNAPSGECFASSDNSNAYKPFNPSMTGQDVGSGIWHSSSPSANQWLAYDFDESVSIKNVHLQNRSYSTDIQYNHPVKTFKIQGSDDNTIWDDETQNISNSNLGQGGQSDYIFVNNLYFNAHRLYVVEGNDNTAVAIYNLQFYGRKHV